MEWARFTLHVSISLALLSSNAPHARHRTVAHKTCAYECWSMRTNLSGNDGVAMGTRCSICNFAGEKTLLVWRFAALLQQSNNHRKTRFFGIRRGKVSVSFHVAKRTAIGNMILVTKKCSVIRFFSGQKNKKKIIFPTVLPMNQDNSDADADANAKRLRAVAEIHSAAMKNACDCNDKVEIYGQTLLTYRIAGAMLAAVPFFGCIAIIAQQAPGRSPMSMASIGLLSSFCGFANIFMLGKMEPIIHAKQRAIQLAARWNAMQSQAFHVANSLHSNMHEDIKESSFKRLLQDSSTPT